MVREALLLLGVALAAAPAARAQNAVGEVFSGDARVRGAVFLSGRGTHVLSGSQVTAGDGTALLKLERGGELRICAKTSLSLIADAAGKALVLGLNAGAMELDYWLPSAADLLLTPDFRLQLISPGTFHLAVSVAPDGDTCLHSLAGNDAAVFISETMGTDSYQLSPGKSVMFAAGKISGATAAPAACGCPETARAMVAEAAPLPAATEKVETAPAENSAPQPEEKMAGVQAPLEAHTVAHLEMESAFVYQGTKAEQDYYGTAARLWLSTDNSKLVLALLPQVSGPAEAEAEPIRKKEGLLHRLWRALR